MLTQGTGSPQLLDRGVSWTLGPACRITGADLIRDGVRLRWSGVEGLSYSVYCSTDLFTPWPMQPLTNGLNGDALGVNDVILPLPATPCVFYWLDVERQ